jgi:phosphate-selective porin OprO/OprP
MNKTTKLLGLTTAILAANSAFALPDFNTDLKDNLDPVFDLATLYKNPDNAVLQKLAFTGRLQGDYYTTENDETGESDSNTAWRRVRVGFKAQMFHDFTVHTEANLDPRNPQPLYTGLTDAYIAWHPTDDWKLKVGKQSAGFTLDGATSSKKLYRTERSLIGDNIWFSQEYFVGTSVSGDVDQWQWNAGVFTNSQTEEFDKTFDNSYFILTSIGYDFAESFGSDKALLRLDYVYQDEPDKNDELQVVATKDHENILSLSFKYDNGKKHIHTDLAYAEQYDGNNIYALQIMPFYDLNDTFQIAGSYTHIESDDAALSVTRYAKNTGKNGGKTAKTESADEFYLGLNTYLYGHKLKWQNGFSYTLTDDDEYEGLTFTSGIRISW